MSRYRILLVFAVGIGCLASPVGASTSTKFVSSITHQVKLGSAIATNYAQSATQSATTNDVYFSEGAKVLVVVGHATPVAFVTAPKSVLALCATSSSLYVETSSTIYEYALNGASFEGSWSLPSHLGPSAPTEAGMAFEGGHLWTWTDWSTDESGYEYGAVVEFNTTTWTSKVFDKNKVDPTDVAADSHGYFFLATNHVVYGQANGTLTSSPATSDASDAPVAALGSNVYLVATREPSDKAYLDTYAISTMTRTGSVSIASETYGVLGTSLGLVGIHESGSTPYVVLINPTTAKETDSVKVQGASNLLFGTTLSAIVDIGGHIYLDRLG